MPDGDQSEEDQLMGEIFQGEIEHSLGRKARTQFKPWHKPRKHFVRLKQWCHETRRLLKQLDAAEGSELRYLGLPGEDLLDIRVLKGVCQRAKVRLRYLGFDSSMDSPQLNLSRHEVNSDRFIHPASVVIADRLEDLGTNDTQAYEYLKKYAPFDVINLDLCDSVTSLAEGGVIPNLEAIRTLCDVQIQYRGQPWLLFLTTRALREELGVQTRQRLFERLLQNIRDNPGFSQALDTGLGLTAAAIHAELGLDGDMGAEYWIRAYVLAVSKWLLHYMMANNYRVTVRMLPSYTYSIQHGCHDMASLAFVLEPAAPPRQDHTGLTQARTVAAAEGATETELAEQLVGTIAAIEDLDQKLADDKPLRLKLFTKSAALLASLRYDMAAYKKFALDD